MELAVTKSIEQDHFSVDFKLELTEAEEGLVKRFRLWADKLPLDGSGKPIELTRFVQGVKFTHADVDRAAEFEETVLERFHLLETECEKVGKFASGDSTIHMFVIETRL